MWIIFVYLIILCESKLYITLAFDDGYTEHLAVGKVLKDKYNFPATFFINSGRLDVNPNRIRRADVVTLHKMGHEIGGHTSDHLNLRNLDTSSQIQQICDDQRVLSNLISDNIVSFAFPFGGSISNFRDISNNCSNRLNTKYIAARGSGGIKSQNGCNGCPVAVSIPITTEQYSLRSIPYRFEMGYDVLIWQIRQAQNSLLDGWLIINFHEVLGFGVTYADDDPNLQYFISYQDFTIFLDWLKTEIDTNNNIKVVTMSDITTKRYLTFTQSQTTQQNQPTQPTQPIQATQPNQPTQTSQPTQPTQPNQPTNDYSATIGIVIGSISGVAILVSLLYIHLFG